MTAHSPTPWRSLYLVDRSLYVLLDADGHRICSFECDEPEDPAWLRWQRDSEHFVAAVNACALVPHPPGLPGLVAILGAVYRGEAPGDKAMATCLLTVLGYDGDTVDALPTLAGGNYPESYAAAQQVLGRGER